MVGLHRARVSGAVHHRALQHRQVAHGATQCTWMTRQPAKYLSKCSGADLACSRAAVGGMATVMGAITSFLQPLMKKFDEMNETLSRIAVSWNEQVCEGTPVAVHD